MATINYSRIELETSRQSLKFRVGAAFEATNKNFFRLALVEPSFTSLSADHDLPMCYKSRLHLMPAYLMMAVIITDEKWAV